METARLTEKEEEEEDAEPGDAGWHHDQRGLDRRFELADQSRGG